MVVDDTLVTTERTKLSTIFVLICPLLGGTLQRVVLLVTSQLVVVNFVAATLEARWLPTFFPSRELAAAAVAAMSWTMTVENTKERVNEEVPEEGDDANGDEQVIVERRWVNMESMVRQHQKT